MTAQLVIVETQYQAHLLSAVLGEAYSVEVVDQPLWAPPTDRLGIDIDHDFAMPEEPIAIQAARRQALQQRLVTVRAVYLATRPSLAGEWLAWQLQQGLPIPVGMPTYRVWLTAQDPSAIRQAFRQPRPIDTHRVEAYQTHRILRRLVGYLVSPALSRLLDRPVGLSFSMAVALQLMKAAQPTSDLLQALSRLPMPLARQMTTLAALEAEQVVRLEGSLALLTDHGQQVRGLVQEYLPLSLAPTTYTRLLAAVQSILRGEESRGVVLSAFWETLQPELRQLHQAALATRPVPYQLDEACPVCGQPLVQHHQATVITCQSFPTCAYSRGLQRQPLHLSLLGGE